MRTTCGVVLVVLLLAVAGCGPGELKEYTSTDGKYKVMMYANPKTYEKSTPLPPPEKGNVKMTAVANDMGTRAILVTHVDIPIPAGETEEKMQKRLDGAKASALSHVKAREVQSTNISIAGKDGTMYPGREFSG